MYKYIFVICHSNPFIIFSDMLLLTYILEFFRDLWHKWSITSRNISIYLWTGKAGIKLRRVSFFVWIAMLCCSFKCDLQASFQTKISLLCKSQKHFLQPKKILYEKENQELHYTAYVKQWTIVLFWMAHNVL